MPGETTDVRTASQNFMTALNELIEAFSAQAAAPKAFYTPAEVAEILGVSAGTVRSAIRAGKFGNTVNPTSSRHLVTAQGLQDYIAAHTGPAHCRKEYRPRRREPLPQGNPGPI